MWKNKTKGGKKLQCRLKIASTVGSCKQRKQLLNLVIRGLPFTSEKIEQLSDHEISEKLSMAEQKVSF